MQLQNILVPTDFSPCASHALTQAVDLAHRRDATLHVVHIVNELSPSWYGLDAAREQAESIQRLIESEAMDRLEALVPPSGEISVRADVDVQVSFDVAEAIESNIEERSIDLVVMGMRGHADDERLGHVAHEIIRHAPCPVLAVNEQAPWATADEQIGHDDLLVPIDFSEASEAALVTAREWAEWYGARLHLLFVGEQRLVPTFSDIGVPTVQRLDMDDTMIENAEAALQQLYESGDGPTGPVSYHVVQGHVAEEVLDYAETHGMSLIVMAPRGLSGMQRFLLGSNTERVVRLAPCPVLTLRQSQDA
ncbi:universal stress protein [Salisaeta longa]|uniref:universal stress protein n=1 Tax=Salisaeta longa TaxID=503170 RepID=UPI0003B6A828|nr:universal stress protein [Salisaeta longa]